MFCTKCGCKIEEGEMFCSGCGTPVVQGTEEKMQMQSPVEAPKKKNHVIPILITIFVLILIGGFAVFAGYDMIQTKKFRETIAEFEELPGKVEGLGKLESEYNELLEEANASASSFLFWKYEEYAENMNPTNSTSCIASRKVSGGRCAIFRQSFAPSAFPILSALSA